MNLSVLERMAREGDMSSDAMRYLLECHGECEWLDYKSQLSLKIDKELCDFARDALAIKNVGGGYIVIGVQDKSWKPIGLRQRIEYDSKLLRDQVRRALGVELEVDIVHHEIQMPSSTGLFALIFVRSSRKRTRRRSPTLCGKDFCTSQSYGLRRGDIYVRRGDSTVKIQSQEELEELLEDLEEQADSDALALSNHISTFAIEDGTYRLLEKGFDRFIGRETLQQELLNAITQDPRLWIVNVHGPGGVGKSALVNWAVYELYQKGTFEAIIQLTAKDTMLTSSGIMRFGRSLYSLENLLDHICMTFQEEPPSNLEERKDLALEILCAWSTLLVLDNMETVQDGRILAFARQLPVESKSKVLLTSRQKSGGWELPFPVMEMDIDEVQEFLKIRSSELQVDFPFDSSSAQQVWQATGGLPLAIQWVLGRYKINPDLGQATDAVIQEDSPVLEFSFRNIWGVLSSDAKAVLATMSIFDEPPTAQQLSIATAFPVERVEKAVDELSDVTLVTRITQSSDGRMTHVALPITLSFAGHQLSMMGDFEVSCRQRIQKFTEQMDLHESELFRFRSRFDKFGLETDNEKRAAILCQRGESETFIGNVEDSELLFRQARDLAPQSSYVYAMSASYEIARNRVGNAINFIEEACSRATRKTGALCFTIKARILDAQRDRPGRLAALEEAMSYEPDDLVTVHQYGVALSRCGREEDAIEQFTKIIDGEKAKIPPTGQMLMAIKTRMINLKRLQREDEFNRDMQFVEGVFQDYPHLAPQREQFIQFYD